MPKPLIQSNPISVDQRCVAKRLLWVSVVTACLIGPVGAAPLETTFTYQGELTDNAAPADGAYDFEFALFDVASGGVPVGNIVPADDVEVSDGVFSVELDFGAGPFAGDQLWLGISVREGASTGGFTGLLPRQKLTAAPYALHAEMVGMDAIASAEISNNTITAADIAANAVGASELANNAVDTPAVQDGAISQAKLSTESVGQSQIISAQVQRRVDGVCTAGSAVASVAEDGSVTCVAAADEVAEPITQADLPLTIDTSGSYYVAENLSYSGQDDAAIRIIVNDVTLDLRGFSLTGDGLGTGNGIEFFGAQTVIRDGSVSRFGGSGIESTLTSSHSGRFERLVVSSNGGSGIALSGGNHIVADCIARGNDVDGIATGTGSLVLRSIAQSNNGDGISVGSDSNAGHNTANLNQGAGIRLATRARASGNVASSNLGSGISGAGDNVIADNRLTSNNSGSSSTEGGIRAGPESHVRDNALSKNNNNGVYVFGSGTLVDNNIISVTGSAVGLDFASNTTNAYRNNVIYNQLIATAPSAENVGGNVFYEP
ncbi:MAG: right-handed parallel beta-helix repeat-containing protein [Pseudomonadota bacterium]